MVLGQCILGALNVERGSHLQMPDFPDGDSRSAQGPQVATPNMGKGKWPTSDTQALPSPLSHFGLVQAYTDAILKQWQAKVEAKCSSLENNYNYCLKVK